MAKVMTGRLKIKVYNTDVKLNRRDLELTVLFKSETVIIDYYPNRVNSLCMINQVQINRWKLLVVFVSP